MERDLYWLAKNLGIYEEILLLAIEIILPFFTKQASAIQFFQVHSDSPEAMLKLTFNNALPSSISPKTSTMQNIPRIHIENVLYG